MRQQQLRKALLLVLHSFVDCKRLDTHLYFIILNFHSEQTSGKCQSWYAFSTFYTVHNDWLIMNA